MAYALKLLVQCLSVSSNLAKVAFDAHKLLSRTVFRILYDGFRKPHLARKFECKRIARQTHLQLEKRGDILHVEHHCAVHDACIG